MECNSCRRPFDLDIHKPMRICEQEHHVCLPCYMDLRKEGRDKCEVCKQPFLKKVGMAMDVYKRLQVKRNKARKVGALDFPASGGMESMERLEEERRDRPEEPKSRRERMGRCAWCCEQLYGLRLAIIVSFFSMQGLFTAGAILTGVNQRSVTNVCIGVQNSLTLSNWLISMAAVDLFYMLIFLFLILLFVCKCYSL
mgnify:CR=1 FL=1